MEGAVERGSSGVARPLIPTGRASRSMLRVFTLLSAVGLALPAYGQGQDAAQKAFTIPWFTTTGGSLIRDMTIAWESHGRLDFRGENAVLMLPGMGERPATATHPMIRALDTRRFFVLGLGAPCGPEEVATSPASRDPETGDVWGADFPALVIRDLVAVQKALSDDLGIKRIRAVIGAGFGGLQALEWRRRYPHLVENAFAIGPPPQDSPGNTGCQADILRQHGEEDAEWVANDPAAIAASIAAVSAN